MLLQASEPSDVVDQLEISLGYDPLSKDPTARKFTYGQTCVESLLVDISAFFVGQFNEDAVCSSLIRPAHDGRILAWGLGAKP